MDILDFIAIMGYTITVFQLGFLFGKCYKKRKKK